MTDHDGDTIREAVRDRYADAARTAQDPCCGDPVAGTGFGSGQYEPNELDLLPSSAVTASLGCGNPTALATLQRGQVVLDLGSGGGIDVLLSARRVGPTGKVYGLDMTPEMLELARRNQADAGIENVEFLLGTIEDIPLPDQAVDVIISNCVINLAADKDVVLGEAHRVLRPGGLFAVSDVVTRKPLSPHLLELVGLWTGCVAGALLDREYETKLRGAGFSDIEIQITHVHERHSLEQLAAQLEIPDDVDTESALDELDGAIANAFIRARA